MDEHAEALEADLLRHFGVDLLDWHRGRLSSRRLAVLIRHLPADSATLRAEAGEAADWSVTEHLLAAAVDHLAQANWMFATVNRDEDADPLDYPAPVPRPGADPPDAAGPDPDADPEPDPRTDPARTPDAAAPSGPSAVELASFFR